MKKFLLFISFLLIVFATSCSNNKKQSLCIYNFGDYISDETIALFEKENDCKIIQDVFESNEEAQPVIENGSKYDVVCLSEYMIERLKNKNYFEELDKSKFQYYSNIDKEVLKIMEACDPGNKYAVPYFRGDEGIVYNKTELDKRGLPIPRKWSDLWNDAYKGELLMQSSIRDLYTVAQCANGYSMNSREKDEIEKCTEDLIRQKPLVQAYLTDQIKDKILHGEAIIAPILSGDIQYIYENGGKDEYWYIVPEGLKGIFVDCWCILKSSTNKDLGYKFIDFLCREDIAKINAEYIGYESVNVTTPDEDFLLMKINGTYADYSNGVELERDIGDAIEYYVKGYNELISY